MFFYRYFLQTIKTLIASTLISPKCYDGLEKVVYLFQLCGNFRMLKLVAVLEHMIRSRNSLLPDSEVEIIVKESLSRLFVAHCVSVEEKVFQEGSFITSHDCVFSKCLS